MQYRTLDPVGCVLVDPPIGELAVGSAGELKRLLAQCGFVVLPAQFIDDHTLLAFLRTLGELTFTPGEKPVEGFPDLNVISNVGRKTPPRSVFHVDSSYLSRPPAYTALRAVLIPAQGGETVFTNQYRAFDTLPPEVRRKLSGRTMTHVVTGLDLDEGAETAARHPVFRRHPISGRQALYLSTPERCVAISGMQPAQAQDMIGFLYAHSTHSANTYAYSWSSGDVVLWDNACVMHRGDHSQVLGDRVLHRGLVAAGNAKAC